MAETLRKAEIRPMTDADIEAVCALMSKDKEVAFCPWEDHRLFSQEIANPSSILLVAELDEQIIGALIGGSYAQRGMICHLDIASDFRRNGIGRELVYQAMSIFESREVRQVHLIVTPGNEKAEKFWKALGFEVDHELQVFEFDIPEQGHEHSLETVRRVSSPENCLCQELVEDSWVLQQISALCNHPEGVVFENTASALFGGRFGFRAEVHALKATPESFHQLLHAACSHFKSRGTMRVHAPLRQGDSHSSLYADFGFRPNVGEKVLVRSW